jgi:hypothetical protein
MRIKVTQEHIDRGEAINVWACPIALALKEQTGRAWAVYACGAVETSGGEANLSSKMTRWTEDYDNAEDVSPIDFNFKPIWYRKK